MKKISEIKSEQTVRNEIKSKQIDTVITVLSLILTIGILLIINYIIITTYHVDTNEIRQQASIISYKSADSFAPEPVERLQYLSSILLAPFLILLSYLFINKHMRSIFDNITNFDTLYISCLGIIIATAIFIFGIIKNTAFVSIYYSKFIFGDPALLIIYCVILFPLTGLIVYLSATKDTINKTAAIVFGCIAGLLTLIIFLCGIFNKTPTYSIYHFNAMFYSVSQAVAGKTLLVDFNNTYGLYPHFIEPILRIVGLSVLNYSIIMSALTALAFLLLYFFLKDNISNKIIALLGFTSITFINYFIFKLDAFDFFDPYNQYWPLRFLFPAILIFLGTTYIKTNNKILYYCSFIISAAAILWNIDTGIFVFASWILLLTYIELYQQNKKVAIINIIKHLITAGNSLIFIFSVYAIYIYIRCGAFPDFIQMLELPQLYIMYGFGMLPLTPLHPWVVIFLVYLWGIVCAVRSLITNTEQEKGKIIWLLTVLGLGVFTYYLGRSHDQVLLAPAYIAVILITIFADTNLSEYKRWGMKISHHLIVTAVLIFILSASIFSIGYHSGQILHFSEMGVSALNNTQQSDITTNINFIKMHTSTGEKIYIYANNYDGLYYGETHTESALNIPGHTDQFFIRDHNIISEFISNNTNTKVFIDRSNNELIAEPDRIPDFNNVLIQKYNIVDISKNGQVALLLPK